MRCVLFTYLSRQATEQKCTSSPLSRSGTASTSATCIPQIGSRTNLRAATPLWGSHDSDPTPAPAAAPPASCSVCAGMAPRNIHAKARRSSATLHDKISNQNKNLTMRAKKFIDVFWFHEPNQVGLNSLTPAFLEAGTLPTTRKSPRVYYIALPR